MSIESPPHVLLPCGIAGAGGNDFWIYVQNERMVDSPEFEVSEGDETEVRGQIYVVVRRISLLDTRFYMPASREDNQMWTADQFVLSATHVTVPMWPEYTREGLISVYAVMYLDGKLIARSDTERVIKCVR